MSVPSFSAHSNDVPANPKKDMTKADWEQRKGYITKCYIDENETFPHIRERLISEGFHVSRRTFTKKISEWGLKKNYSKKEREQILKSRKNIERFKSDRRVTKAKIQRWQKQFGTYEIDTRTTRKSVCIGYPGHSQIIELSSSGPSQTRSQNSLTYGTEDLDDELEVEPPFTERHRQEGSSMVLDQQFPEHASRNLVQLLSQLGISVDPTVEKDEDPPTREKLRTEATSDGRTLTKWQHHCTRTEDSFLHATDATNAKANDFASSLYIGIGIFSNSRRQAPRLSWADYSFKYRVAWPREVEQLKAKLSDSQAQVLPIIQKVSVLQKLARIYYNLNWYRSSLEMQQQLLAARKSQQQINPNELVITCLEIVDLYLFRQDFRTAARVHSAIHFQIQKILSPKHPIHLFSSYLYALILYRQSKYREGEKIIRTVVQITYGWNNLFSIRALQLLGWFMEMNSSALLAYVENSYRFNLDNLGSGNLIVDYLNWYLTTGDVLRVLISQGDYKAGDKLCAYIIERVGLVDGEDDLDYLAVQRLQAQIWYHQGKLSESCNLLCKLVNDLDSFDEYTNPLLQRNLFYTLALVQEKMGDDVGAMKCYRKCLEMEIRVYGLQHEVTLDACGDIGDCYGRLGRHGDALRFYGKVVERLRNILGSDHDSVKMVEEWSEWTRENMEEARKKVSSVEDTDEDEDMDRDEGTDMEGAGNSAIRKTVEEMDRDSDSDCDLSFDGAGEMAHDNLQDDILQYFDWDAFFDCPTPSFYGFN